MKNENRSHIMYMQDIQIAMSRITEYIANIDFIKFKKDYKTVGAV